MTLSGGDASLLVARLDPRAKLGATVVLMLPLLTHATPATVWSYGVCLGLAMVFSASVRRAARTALPVVWLGVGLVFFTAVATPEEPVLRVGGILPLSGPGAATGGLLAMRMIELVMMGALLAATTAPFSLAAASQWLLQPLRRFHVDVQALSLLVLLVLRFVPVLRAEIATTEAAMRLRGLRFREHPLDQVRRLAALAVPVLGRAMVAADDLAIALVTRGYGLGQLKPIEEMRFRGRDVVLLLGSIGLAVATLVFL